jgi:uncharacterized YigZ family protein
LIYQSITDRKSFILKEKGSKFIGVAFPCNSIDSFKSGLTDIQIEYPKATHYCYAYRFFGSPVSIRANDDGEPSNSAGTPILGQIQSFELFDVAIVVVRYYGGTKLGVSGLVQTYKGAAKSVLENSTFCLKETSSLYKISGDFLSISQLLSFLKKHEIKIISQKLFEEAEIIIELPESKLAIIEPKLNQFSIEVNPE